MGSANLIRALALILALVLLMTWAGAMWRYQLLVIPNQEGHGVAYRLDRWSGQVRLLDEDQWYPVTQGDPESLRQAPNAPGDSAFRGF